MTDTEAPNGVVVHLDEADTDKQQAVLRNVGNLLDEMGPDLRVELVAHGPGISVCLTDSPHAATVTALIGRSVTVAACGNTMRMKHIEADRLADGVVTVASGLAELVRKQQDGWAYVRP
jgi:intracellular sulfur oxidation DsrE/DsrF family protein